MPERSTLCLSRSSHAAMRSVVLAKQKRAALSYQHGVRPRLRCNVAGAMLAANVAQLRGLVEHSAVLQICWAMHCQGLLDAARKVAFAYRGYAFQCNMASLEAILST